MAQAPSILNADRGRASVAALGFLCLLAAVQAVLVATAVWRSPPDGPDAQKPAVGQTVGAAPAVLQSTAPPPPTIRFSPPLVGQLAPAAPPPMPAPPSGAGFAPPPIGSFAAPSGRLPPVSQPSNPALPPAATPPQASLQTPPAPSPGPINVPPAPAATGSDPAAGMSLQEMVDLAKQVRALGDMQGALEVLKRADLQYPARPEVLAETAQCYETMGLSDKAASLWRQLESMDPARAAGFRDLAQRRLAAPAPASLAGGADNSFTGAGEGPTMLSLGACQAVRDASVVNGEKVVLRIPILRNGNTTPDPAQVDIDVYFFDRVNGEKVALTIADEPVSSWAAAPVDWSGIGEEPLDVTYFLPALTPGETSAHGRRSYHGYVVRLYYQHKLQDVAAEPRDLLDFGSRAPQTVPDGINPLLPPVTN